MTSGTEIKSEKVLVQKIFSDMWFRIPPYQRHYVWESDQINDLLDDLAFALKDKPDSQYFFGPLVFQSKTDGTDEKDLLDGQQRLTTVLILFAVIRDLSTDRTAKECQSCIYMKENPYKRIPEQTRLVYAIRDDAQGFIDSFIKIEKGTVNDEIKQLSKTEKNVSVANMANAVQVIHKFFDTNSTIMPEKLLDFLLNKVLLIYVSTEDFDDAFRLFTIINARGIPLRNSDILKAINLGALETEADEDKYAKLWEEAEGDLEDGLCP